MLWNYVPSDVSTSIVEHFQPETWAAVLASGRITSLQGAPMLSASDIQRTARRAGVLYLVLSIVAMFSFFYLRPRFVISGDAAATASNILAHEQLYRTG